MDTADAPDMSENLQEEAEEIRDYVERNSPRPSVDGELADRYLTEAPPAEAAAELTKMVDGWQSGAGAATGRRTEPVPDEAPTEDLPQ